MEFYFFNWTNWEEFHVPSEIESDKYEYKSRADIKPQFQELGPYVFEEIHERVGIVYDDDDKIISFNQTKTWWFRKDLSRGSLDDKITSLNPIATVSSFYLLKLYGVSIFFFLIKDN